MDEHVAPGATAWSHAIAQQLLARYGIVFRETAHAEGLPGGFSAIYDVMKALEESGKIRRGYFVAELGATQFAVPAAVDLLRSLRLPSTPDRSVMIQLAATDPANPYGALLRWPGDGTALSRSVGARVILCDGDLVLYMRRDNPNVQMFLPDDEPQRSYVAERLARFLVEQSRARGEEDSRAGILISTINGVPVAKHWMAHHLTEAGFYAGARGFNVRKQRDPSGQTPGRTH